MKTEEEKYDTFTSMQFHIAKLSNNFPDIITMKSRIENGNIDRNVITEWLKIREEWNNCSIELKEMLENKRTVELFIHPIMRKLCWLMVNYIYGNVERLKLILENDIDTLPKGNEIFYNSVDSQEITIDFLIKKEGIEKWKDRIEMDSLYFTEQNSTKSANRALNKIMSKGKTLPLNDKIFPTIDIEKYNSDLIFKNCKTIFYCENRAVFDAWFVDGIGCTTKMKWLNKEHGAPIQLKTFISEITGRTNLLVKPINLAFDLPIDSNTRITSLLPKTTLLLKTCLKI